MLDLIGDRVVLRRARHDRQGDAVLVEVGYRFPVRLDLRVRLVEDERNLVLPWRYRIVDRERALAGAIEGQGDVPFARLHAGNDVVPRRIDELHFDAQYLFAKFLDEIDEDAAVLAGLRITHDVRRGERRAGTQHTPILHVLPQVLRLLRRRWLSDSRERKCNADGA